MSNGQNVEREQFALVGGCQPTELMLFFALLYTSASWVKEKDLSPSELAKFTASQAAEKAAKMEAAEKAAKTEAPPKPKAPKPEAAKRNAPENEGNKDAAAAATEACSPSKETYNGGDRSDGGDRIDGDYDDSNDDGIAGDSYNDDNDNDDNDNADADDSAAENGVPQQPVEEDNFVTGVDENSRNNCSSEKPDTIGLTWPQGVPIGTPGLKGDEYKSLEEGTYKHLEKWGKDNPLVKAYTIIEVWDAWEKQNTSSADYIEKVFSPPPSPWFPPASVP